jgi:hypothetical protein
MRALFIFFIFAFAGTCIAGDAEIVKVKIEVTSAQKYNFTVTIKHADTGWEHFANAFRVYSPEGELIGERVLHHPHVKEQPFTRTLLGVSVPSGLSEVVIKASCFTAGENKKGYTVKLR